MSKFGSHKSAYEWLGRYMHHATSQIRQGMKTQWFHGFRSYQIYFKKVITSLKKLYAALNTFFLFTFLLFKDRVLETQLRIEFLTPNIGV